MKNKIFKIFISVVLLNLVVVNSTFAVVVPVPPPSPTITANPNPSSAPYQPVTLSWTTVNGATVDIEPNDDIGNTALTGTSGSVTVYPPNTMAYTIVATNPGNGLSSSQGSVLVTVTGTTATGAAGASGNIILNNAAFLAAQASPSACAAFSQNVTAVNSSFKATYIPISGGVGGRGGTSAASCRVIDANITATGQAAYSQSTSAATNFETQIRQSKTGITSQAAADAATKARAEQTQAGPISALFGWVINTILGLVATVLGQLTALAGSIFSAVVENIITAAPTPSVVVIGWTVVRDICNMFFILAMIVIALGTILRLKDYQEYGHLLRDLIIMALLVNFSLVISVTIMNAVNFLAAIFYGQGFGLGQIYAKLMSIAGGFSFADNLNASISSGWTGSLAIGLGRIAFMIVGFVVFLALAGMFVIRLVGLYILIIFSPIAYVARILPQTEHFSEEWWSHFLKYLIWAPIAMFMLRLVFVVSNTGTDWTNNTSLYFFILTAFLAAAVLVAEEAGMVGSKAIIGAVEKGAHAVGHRAMHYAGRRYNEWTTHAFATPHEGQSLSTGKRIAFAVLNPVAALKGWNERSEELSHHAQAVAKARGREAIDIWATGKGVKGTFGLVRTGGATLPHAQIEERKAENEKLKVLVDLKKEQLMNFIQDAENIQGHEGETTRLAAMKAAAMNGFMDDVLRMNHFAEKYGEVVTDKETGEQKVLLSSPDTIQRFLRGYLGNGEQSMRFAAEDMEEAGKKTNHAEYLGHAYFDPQSRAFKWGMDEVKGQEGENVKGEKISTYVNKHQAEYASGEWEKLTPNQLSTTAPHSLAAQYANVKMVDGKRQIVTGEDGVTTGGREIQNIVWGNGTGEGATQASNAFYSGITKIVGEERVIDRFQNVQVRTKDRMLVKDMDANTGTLVVKDAMEMRKIVELWKTNPDFARAFYAQKLNIDIKSRNKLNNIRIRYAGKDVTIDGRKFVNNPNTTILVDEKAGDVNIEKILDENKPKANTSGTTTTTTIPAPTVPPTTPTP